jgi:hypothetical protein
VYVVVKDRIWPSIGYSPHEGQQDIHHSLARHRIAACGRRWGKSTVGGKELVAEAVKTYTQLSKLREEGKQRRFWIVGPDYSDGDKEFRVTWSDFQKLELPMDHPGSYYYPNQGNMHISLWNGLFQVHVKSARNPDSLDGEGLCGVEMVEAAKLKPHIFSKYIRPALADERGWSTMTSTPEGKNWFYEMWQYGQDPSKPTWNSWRLPSWTNPVVFPEGRNDPEILDMEAEMSPERFNQEIGADFTEFVGQVFKDFDEEIHVKDLDYRPDLPLFGCTDYGFTNPWVWLGIQVDVFNNVYVIGEYRVTHRDINDIVSDLKGIPWVSHATDLYPEPADPGDSAVLEKELKIRLHKNTGGELKWRLELIKNHLKFDPLSAGHPDEIRKPRLFIDRKCYGLIQEMLDYRYPSTKEESLRAQPEHPLDTDNHGPEALGRFFRGYFGGPGDSGTERTRARIRKARVG